MGSAESPSRCFGLWRKAGQKKHFPFFGPCYLSTRLQIRPNECHAFPALNFVLFNPRIRLAKHHEKEERGRSSAFSKGDKNICPLPGSYRQHSDICMSTKALICQLLEGSLKIYGKSQVQGRANYTLWKGFRSKNLPNCLIKHVSALSAPLAPSCCFSKLHRHMNPWAQVYFMEVVVQIFRPFFFIVKFSLKSSEIVLCNKFGMSWGAHPNSVMRLSSDIEPDPISESTAQSHCTDRNR